MKRQSMLIRTAVLCALAGMAGCSGGSDAAGQNASATSSPAGAAVLGPALETRDRNGKDYMETSVGTCG